MPTQDWRGHNGFTPWNLDEPDTKTSRIYEDVTRRAGYKIMDAQGKLRKWDSRFEGARAPFVDAYGDIVNCGRIRGRVVSCECGAEFVRPLGCRSRFCLYCESILSANRARKVLLKTDRLHQNERFVWGRCVFTVHPDLQIYCSSKEGSDQMMKRAVKAMVKVLDVPKQNLFVYTTFHPTSSKKPWLLHPHVELIWAHANVGKEGIVPLKLHESGILKPIELDYLQDIWQNYYPGTKNLHVSYKKELHFGFIRYLVRPMAEDIWWAIKEGRLDADENGTIPALAEIGFRSEGGVIFWPGYQRSRWHGAGSNNTFGGLMRALNKPRIIEPNGCTDCPDCEGGKVTTERTDEGNRTVSLSPYHEPEIAYLMFTTCKSNSRKGDQAHV